MFHSCSNSYTGKKKAYGGGNGNNLNTVKAGPGTIYMLEGKAPKEVHSITIAGDADSPVQQQTRAYISGNPGEFEYDLMQIESKPPTLFAKELLSESICLYIFSNLNT